MSGSGHLQTDPSRGLDWTLDASLNMDDASVVAAGQDGSPTPDTFGGTWAPRSTGAWTGRRPRAGSPLASSWGLGGQWSWR
jgi:hypothetical protein